VTKACRLHLGSSQSLDTKAWSMCSNIGVRALVAPSIQPSTTEGVSVSNIGMLDGPEYFAYP
jgi:hypothetical protein